MTKYELLDVVCCRPTPWYCTPAAWWGLSCGLGTFLLLGVACLPLGLALGATAHWDPAGVWILPTSLGGTFVALLVANLWAYFRDAYLQARLLHSGETLESACSSAMAPVIARARAPRV
jgi:hypothetical protein